MQATVDLEDVLVDNPLVIVVKFHGIIEEDVACNKEKYDK